MITPGPLLPEIHWHLNEKTIREKLARVKSTTDLECVRPTAGIFRGWAVVYGQIQANADSLIALVRSGNGLGLAIDPENCFAQVR